ncbi:MFS transporter [Winogradskyella arenosi]|uniref:DHA1 family arabinose polymer transporter-like MFS transporter n=1 Tax=Winogradskyella arenosi TaxID=533325 RepID=A0A368ZLE5_9FLAO|nr:MFS transporter [Winogradskyella arenosi]RCW93947.1 DHA1 family arabinose polymer transporter-like MFS transporter [Winogradskyella arenosi]
MKEGFSNKKALLSLAIGGFGIGLTEFVIMGILPNVAHALNITIPEAGHFISAYALGVVVGAPLLTSFSHKLQPHRMLLLLMVWFTVFNTLSAFSANYNMLLVMRFLSGLPHGAFFGVGAVIAGKLAKKGKSAQAIAMMFSGLTVANVIGVPIGTYLGNQYHWSASFLMVGVVGCITLASIFYWMPQFEKEEKAPQNSDHKGLKNPELWALIALTTIGTGGFFAWYSYIAPLLTDVAHFSENVVSYAMILAGLGMFIGNFLGAKMANAFTPLRAVMISLLGMAFILVVNSFLASNAVLALLLTFLIGLIAFSISTPIQMAIINTAKGAEMLGSSMNQSAFNMGNAMGAYLAGLPIAFGHSVTSSSLVGASLAFSGAVIAITILMYRKQKQRKKDNMLCESHS